MIEFSTAKLKQLKTELDNINSDITSLLKERETMISYASADEVNGIIYTESKDPSRYYRTRFHTSVVEILSIRNRFEQKITYTIHVLCYEPSKLLQINCPIIRRRMAYADIGFMFGEFEDLEVAKIWYSRFVVDMLSKCGAPVSFENEFQLGLF